MDHSEVRLVGHWTGVRNSRGQCRELQPPWNERRTSSALTHPPLTAHQRFHKRESPHGQGFDGLSRPVHVASATCPLHHFRAKSDPNTSGPRTTGADGGFDAQTALDAVAFSLRATARATRGRIDSSHRAGLAYAIRSDLRARSADTVLPLGWEDKVSDKTLPMVMNAGGCARYALYRYAMHWLTEATNRDCSEDRMLSHWLTEPQTN